MDGDQAKPAKAKPQLNRKPLPALTCQRYWLHQLAIETISTSVMSIVPRLIAAALVLAALPSVGTARASVFNRTLTQQGVTVHIQASDEGSQQQLTIRIEGTRRPIATIRQSVTGHVSGAQIADLIGNGQPEIYVFVQGAGSGRYGDLLAYAINNGMSVSPIALQELSGSMAEGYRGHDSFAVVEGCVVRRFPIYRVTDNLVQATGRERQICYKPSAGEATWILRPTSVLTF